MIGSTNGKLAYSTIDKVSITLLTDDNAHDKLMGVIVTVSYDAKSTKYIWDGNTIKVKIPAYSEYSISVSNITGYVTPTVFTAIALMDGETVVDLVYYSVVDLSRVDIYGNPIALNTANCYVIKEVGTYKLPLVFGNALKNDSTNSAAYTKNSGSNSHDFVDFNGTKITSPYIETVSGTAASALLSIADTNGIFTDISIIDGSPCRYLRFKVNSVPATGANGILSIKNSSGVIMWSWHIWVWPYDLTPVEITNNTGVKYNILPVNLATKLDSTDSINKTTGWKNWFYLFGRPTPLLCPAAYNSTSDHASYGALNHTAASIASNIQTGIQNPATFYIYNESNNYNWFRTNSGKTYNLWDAACTSTGNRDNNVVKTIYDPCPIGFKMPNGNTFTYFSTSNMVGSFVNGWKLKRYSSDTVGIFFPASGSRGYTSGVIGSVLFSSYVSLSSACSNNEAYCLGLSLNGIYPLSQIFRSYGCSVRPVKDEDLALPTHKLTINVGADNSVLPSGFEIKVYQVIQSTDKTTGEIIETLGNVLATQTTVSATHEITWGTRYKIVANDCTGYDTPSSKTFVADVETRSVNMTYGEKWIGAAIMDVNHNFYFDAAAWQAAGSPTPNGVAISDGIHRFCIAKDMIEHPHSNNASDYGPYGLYNTQINNITTTTGETTAANDFNGVINTDAMANLNVYDNYFTTRPGSAAGLCRQFTFPDGSKGYLGAVGEWKLVQNRITEVNTLMAAIGGSQIDTSSYPYWSSTQYDAVKSWAYDFIVKKHKTMIKYYSSRVRAFCTF